MILLLKRLHFKDINLTVAVKLKITATVMVTDEEDIQFIKYSLRRFEV